MIFLINISTKCNELFYTYHLKAIFQVLAVDPLIIRSVKVSFFTGGMTFLLPNQLSSTDSSVTDRLRHAKTFQHIPARTNKFQNSFIPYCLRYYD